MSKHSILLAALATAGLAFAPLASASPFTTPSGFGPVVEDFEGFDGLVTTGPETLAGGVTVTSDIDSTIGAFVADLGANGTWGAGNNFAAIGDLFEFGAVFVGSMTFSFSPSHGAGAYFNYYRDDTFQNSITIEALDALDNVLETYTQIIETDVTDLNTGQFLGIAIASADVAALRVSGDGFVLDDLRIAAAPVPLPPAVLLMAGGLVLLGGRPRRCISSVLTVCQSRRSSLATS